jgi:hypothetical protein
LGEKLNGRSTGREWTAKMGTVFTSHGVVEQPERELFVHRNMLDRESFREYLRARTDDPFVNLTRALNGEGDALTFDDATEASADGASLAVGLGHQVSLFVNPFNVENGLPYIFVLLNVMLDEINTEPVLFDGARYFQTAREKRRLRLRIKDKLARVTDYFERLEIVKEISRANRVSCDNVPAHLATLSKERLLHLAGMGVNIENHGWFHCHFSSLSEDECYENVARAKSWFSSELGLDVRHFAVPFGDVLPQSTRQLREHESWLLLHHLLPEGFIGDGIYNRAVLSL